MVVAVSKPIRSARPSADELAARAAEVGKLARERAADAERDRCVAADVVAAARDAELFRILQPAAFGGFEYGYDVFADCVKEVAAGDGSAGWVCSLGAAHQWLIACFPMQAQQDVWGQTPNAIAAGSYAPAGTAVPADGGHRITGRWSFASGCDHMQWAVIGSLLTKADGGKAPGFLLVPKSDYAIDDDWFTMGLAGTGSKTLVATDVFVPHHRTVMFSDMLVGNAPGANGNPLYRQPLLAVMPTCLVAPQLGMARGALDVFVEQVKGRKTRGAVAGGNASMADFVAVQMRVAEAAACADTAALLIRRDLQETAELAARGEAGVDLRLRNRRDHSFASRLCVQAVDALFAAAGGSGLGLQHPLQRFWRDIHAAGAHISMNWDVVGAMYGQHVFGLEPKGQY